MPPDDRAQDRPHGHALAEAEVRLLVSGGADAGRAATVEQLELELAAADYPGATIDLHCGDSQPAGTPLVVRVRALAEDLLTGQVLAVALVRRALDSVRALAVPQAVFVDEVGLAVSWARPLR